MVLLGVAWREWEALCSLCSIDCRRRGRKGGECCLLFVFTFYLLIMVCIYLKYIQYYVVIDSLGIMSLRWSSREKWEK